jgi:hypothetical protein
VRPIAHALLVGLMIGSDRWPKDLPEDQVRHLTQNLCRLAGTHFASQASARKLRLKSANVQFLSRSPTLRGALYVVVFG